MPLKVIALGAGVCATCGVKGPRRYPPGFLIDYNGQLLLLEASEGIRFRIEDAGYDYGKVAHIALSHVHPDHAALPQLLQSKLCRVLWGPEAEGIHHATVYMHEASVEGFEAVWKWHHPEAGDELHHFPDKFVFDLIPMRTGFDHEIFPGLHLKAFGVYHGFGQHPALGFRVETPEAIVVYTGDAGLTDSLFVNVAGADLLISDSSVRLGQAYTGGYGHLEAGQSGMLATQGHVKTLWLTHYLGLDEPAAMEHAVRQAGFTGQVAVVADQQIWSP